MDQRKLPHELIDMVISELAGHKDALCACSLACRSTRNRSQKVLFHALYIHFHPEVDFANRRLRLLLETDARLASYVELLSFVFHDDGPATPEESEEPPVRDPYGFEGSPLMLPRLRILELCAVDGDILDWSVLPNEFQQDLLHIIHHPSITQLTTVGDCVETPLEEFLCLERLETQVDESHNVYLHYINHPSPSPSLPPLCSDLPRYLDVVILNTPFQSYCLCQHLLRPTSRVSVSHARDLAYLWVQDYAVVNCQGMLDQAAGSLLHVSLSALFDYMDTFLVQYPNLQMLKNLEWLEINVYRAVETDAVNPGPWICQLLQTLPQTNHLKTVILRAKGLAAQNWLQIDQILASKLQQEILQQVVVTCHQSRFHAILPQLFSTGHLSEYQYVQ